MKLVHVNVRADLEKIAILFPISDQVCPIMNRDQVASRVSQRTQVILFLLNNDDNF